MPKHNVQTEQQAFWNTKSKDMLNLLHTLASVYTGAVTPVLRSGFGTHGMSPFVFTVIFMLWVGAFLQCGELLLYFPLWLGFVAYRRVTADREAHSAYGGFPWLACLIPSVNTEYKGRLIEPWLVFFLGTYLAADSKPLGLFVMGAGIALFIVLLIEQAAISARKRAIHDARCEAQQWAALDRGESGWE